MGKKTLPEPPLESPIPFSTGCNGEFIPREPGDRERRSEEMFRALVDERSGKLGISRRSLQSKMKELGLREEIAKQGGVASPDLDDDDDDV